MTQELATQLKEQGDAITKCLNGFRDMVVETQEQYSEASEILLKTMTRIKELDEQEKTVTKPMNAALKAARDMFKPVKGPLETIRDILKGKLANYEIAQKRAQQLAQQEAQQKFLEAQTAESMGEKALAAGLREQGLAVVNQMSEGVEKPKGLSTRATVKWEITDPGLVPREFCAPDPGKIREAVKLGGSRTAIPGVRVWEDVTVVGRV